VTRHFEEIRLCQWSKASQPLGLSGFRELHLRQGGRFGDLPHQRKEILMKRVFTVTIHYHGNTTSDVDVIAANDVQARKAALVEDSKSYEAENIKPPKIEYCETSFMCEAVVA